MRDKETVQAAQQHFARLRRADEALRNLGIAINYVHPVVFQGKKLWALGHKIYYNRRRQETFHEFILSILQQTLGREWWERESAASTPHYLRECFRAYAALSKKNASPENMLPDGIYSMVPDGASRYLVSVAFDIATLMHAADLPEDLLRRLRNRDQFQGARYEIGIAAVFARLDYEIAFLDESTQPDLKHCEFIATSRATGASIAVEAKSRHRPGVLHLAGDFDKAQLAHVDVTRQLREASSQAPGDRPFFVFIDLNVPLSGDREVVGQTWAAEILTSVNQRFPADPNAPTAFTSVYVTNFSYHYDAGSSQKGNEVLEIQSAFPMCRVTSQEIYDLLPRALGHYGNVPSFDVEGVLRQE